MTLAASLPPLEPPRLYDPLFHTPQENLYEVYSQLRTHHPVYHCASRSVWCLTRHSDVQSAARDWQTFGTEPGVDLDAPNYMGPGNFIDADPPRHDVLRNVVRSYFTPKAIAQLAEDIASRVQRVIDEIRERERADLAHDFAWRLPIWVISRLLGVPEQDDELVQRLLLDTLVRQPGDPAVPERADTGLSQLQVYLRDLAAHKRTKPDDKVLARMVAAEADGVPTPEETVGMATMFFIAGSETTFALLGNALKLLAEHPDALRALRTARTPHLLDAAIEEVVRYESPVQYLARTVRRSATSHGVELAEGNRVILVWGAANRDPERWSEPNKFDIHRAPQRHIGFGEGIHFCLGAHLARLEARIALPMFIDTFRDYEIGEARRLQSHIVRGWERLIATLEPTGSHSASRCL